MVDNKIPSTTFATWAIPTEVIHEMEIVSGRLLDPLLTAIGTYPGSQVDKNDSHGWDVKLHHATILHTSIDCKLDFS